MPTPVQSAAVQAIDDKLQTGWFNPVTHADIKSVSDTLQGLNGADAKAVIAELKAQGKLDQIASESIDGSIAGLGGLSTGERSALFNNLAGKLDGASLADLTRAFGRTDSQTNGARYVEELGKAVATHATPDAKVQFVTNLKGATVDHPNRASAGFGGSTMVDGDADAVAVGDVIGSLRGAYAQTAIASLSPNELKAVMTASIDATYRVTATGAGATGALDWNANSFNAIMTAGATVGSAHVKATLFEAGAAVMRGVDHTPGLQLGTAVIGKDAALSKMTEGLTAVLSSDVGGVMRDMAYSGASKNGTAMASYTKQMLGDNGTAAGGKARLGEFMAKLQMGNSLNADPVKYLNATTTVAGTDQSQRTNAGALGYFVGSVYKGADARSKDVKDQQDMVNAVLKSGLTILDKAKVGGLAGQTIASVGKEWTIYAVRAAIRDEGNGAAVKLENAALPINPANDRLGVGDAVFSAFEDHLTSTARTAQP